MINEIAGHHRPGRRVDAPPGNRAEQAWKRSMKAHAQVVDLIKAGDADGAVVLAQSPAHRDVTLTGPAL